MTSIRRFTCDDLFTYNNVQLDRLTETYNLPFYLQYLATWPEYCALAEGPGQQARMGFDPPHPAPSQPAAAAQPGCHWPAPCRSWATSWGKWRAPPPTGTVTSQPSQWPPTFGGRRWPSAWLAGRRPHCARSPMGRPAPHVWGAWCRVYWGADMAAGSWQQHAGGAAAAQQHRPRPPAHPRMPPPPPPGRKLMALLEDVTIHVHDAYFVDLFVRKSNALAIKVTTPPLVNAPARQAPRAPSQPRHGRSC
jgi:ribosomal protein S18 acetylase RimI-like enzyme